MHLRVCDLCSRVAGDGAMLKDTPQADGKNGEATPAQSRPKLR